MRCVVRAFATSFPGLAMGLFSFLTGGKKKEAKAAPVTAAPVAVKPTVAEAKAEVALAKAIAPIVVPEPVKVAATGVAQAKLRMKLAASLRAGQHAAFPGGGGWAGTVG